MAIVEVTLQQTYDSKPIYNVFHYLCLTNEGFGAGWMTALIEKFETDVVNVVNEIQVAGVSNVSLKAVQIENTNLQVSKSVPDGGEVTDNVQFYAPAAQTYAFRLFVAPSRNANDATLYSGNRRITDGYKRFTGVSDAFLVDRSWDATWAEGAQVDAIREALAATLELPVSGDNEAVPIVYGRAIEQRGLPGDENYLPARQALYAEVTSAVLVPPRWTRRRQ